MLLLPCTVQYLARSPKATAGLVQMPRCARPLPAGLNPPRGAKQPAVVLMAGLQGVGKTTACGKLAMYLRKQGKRVLMVATDVYRPAAIDQVRSGCQIAI